MRRRRRPNLTKVLKQSNDIRKYHYLALLYKIEKIW